MRFEGAGGAQYGRYRFHRVGPWLQLSIPVFVIVTGDCRIPSAPDEELQKHHRGQLAADAHGSTRILMSRYATRSP